MDNENGFYGKKFVILATTLSKLRAAQKFLVAAAQHEDTAPDGDGQAEYAAVFADLAAVISSIEGLAEAVGPMANAEHVAEVSQ